MAFNFQHTDIPGVIIITPKVFADDRGFFMETYKKSEFTAAGITEDFVQDNHSRSSKNVLRGLHFQHVPFAQGKLVRVVAGTVWDVAVDMRPGSPAYKKWLAVELSAHNNRVVYIPPWCYHGFLSLTDDVHLMYKCTKEYSPQHDAGIRWNDPDINIAWPVKEPLLSPKDMQLPFLKEIRR